MVQHLATPTDTPTRIPTDVTHPADYVRASRELAACTRLVTRHNRINFTAEEILAEVVAFDHAEAFDLNAARAPFDPSRLTAAQADGLSCVVCSADYLTVAVPHRPVGRSATGSQVFACSWTCVGGAR